MKKRLVLLLFCQQLLAAEVDVHTFQDTALEKRFQALTAELRCLVCQNQNIADSHAELAQDLRNKVHELLLRGDSDEQIVSYMTDRYGDFVLYRPPFKFKTLILWLAPLLALLGGGIGFWSLLKRRHANAEVLSDAERQRIEQLLNKE